MSADFYHCRSDAILSTPICTEHTPFCCNKPRGLLLQVSSLEEKISQLDTSWNTLNEKIAESETKISKMLADHDQERLEAEKAKFDLVGQLQKVTVQHAEEKEVLLKQTASFTAEVNDAKKIAGRVPDLEAEIASTNQALSRDAQKFQDEKSLLMQKLEEGKKDTVRLTHELEEKCSQLETAREALSTAEDSLNILKVCVWVDGTFKLVFNKSYLSLALCRA